MFTISPSTRLRPSPFYEATVAAGVTSFTAYNHRLMPTGYGDPDAEYWRLISGVSLWDVAVERQVQLLGPDAARLAQVLVTRDLSLCAVGRGKYVALCNHAGTLINDPVLLKLAEDRFWLSIADSNILFWARAIAAERRFVVSVTEPDVSPLAVQGPKAEDVIASMFGDWARDLGYFWFRETSLDGIPLVVARSGWSKQGGFELYLMDGSKGVALWDRVVEAGRPWGIGPGYPNPCERIESGLLSWGGDTDDITNPFEVRMGKYITLNLPADVIGITALKRIYAEGPKRHQLGLILDGDAPLPVQNRWRFLYRDNERVGALTCSIWSRRLQKNIGFALIARDCEPGQRVDVGLDDGGRLGGELVRLPFL